MSKVNFIIAGVQKAGTELISNTATQTMTNKSLTAPTLTGTTTAAAANFSGTVTFAGGSGAA